MMVIMLKAWGVDITAFTIPDDDEEELKKLGAKDV